MRLEISFKSAIEIVGSLAALASMGLLFVSEKYVAGSVVAGVAVLLLSLAVSTALSGPVTYKSVQWDMRICDADGHESHLRKTKRLIVNEGNITTLADRNFSASGKFEFKKSNIGQMLPPVDEGGTKTVYTTFQTALPRGRELEHILEIVAWDTFGESRETLSYMVTHRTGEVRIRIEFPDTRPPRVPKAFRIYKERVDEVAGLTCTNEGRVLHLVVPRPKVGSKYMVQWEW
jgi:hypothetical protein